MAQLFMSDLDIDFTFSHADDSAFCTEEKGEILNDEEQEQAIWGTLIDKDAEEDGCEDDLNGGFPEDLTLWMPSYIGVSPTGRSVLLIGLGFVTFRLFRSLQTLLNVEARTASSLVGEFRVDELTEGVVRFRSGGLFRHEQVHQ